MKMFVTRRAVFTTAHVKMLHIADDTIVTGNDKLMGYFDTCDSALKALIEKFAGNTEYRPIVVTEMSYTVETMGQPVSVWCQNCTFMKSEPISADDAAMFGKRVSSEN